MSMFDLKDVEGRCRGIVHSEFGSEARLEYMAGAVYQGNGENPFTVVIVSGPMNRMKPDGYAVLYAVLTEIGALHTGNYDLTLEEALNELERRTQYPTGLRQCESIGVIA